MRKWTSSSAEITQNPDLLQSQIQVMGYNQALERSAYNHTHTYAHTHS